MAGDVTRKVVLEGKVDSIKQGLRDTAQELRKLQRQVKDGIPLTEMQKTQMLDLKDAQANLRDESAKYRVELRKAKNAERAVFRARKKAAEQTKKAAAALAVLVVMAAKSVKAFADQDAATGRLSRAYDQAGASAKDFADAQDEIRKNGRELGVSVREQTDALRALADATGDVAKSREGLNLAMDIASQKNISLEAAAEKVAKVHLGEVEVLKELGILTKDEAEALGQVESQSERTSIAMQALTEKFDGAAKANKGSADEMAAMKIVAEGLEEAIGDNVDALGDFGTGLIGSLAMAATGANSAADGLEAMRKGLTDNASAIREAIGDVDALVRGLSSLDALDKASIIAPLMLGPAGVPLALANLARTAPDAISAGRTQEAVIAGGQPAGMDFGVDEGLDVSGSTTGSVSSRIKRAKKKGDGGPAGFDFTPDELRADEEAASLARAKRSEEEAAAHAAFAEMKAEEIRLQNEQNLATEIYQERIDGASQAWRDNQAAEVLKAQELALKKSNDAAQMGLGIAGNLAGQFIEGEGAKAVISAAVEGAKALSAAATPGGQASALGHAAAAGQYLVAAALAGKSGGSSGGGGGGTASAAPAAPVANEAGGLVGAGLGGPSSGNAQGIGIVVNFSSVSKPTPEEARVIADAVADEMRTRA